MKVELEITDEIEDAVLVESLKWHLENLPFAEDPEYYAEISAAFKMVLEYYGYKEEVLDT